MDSSETLMLTGVAGYCPDCGEERILLEVAEMEFCCTTCDAAVLRMEAQRGATQVAERRAG